MLGTFGLTPGLYDKANIPISSKIFLGGQFHYQWSERFAMSISILGGLPYTEIDSKYQSKGATIYSAIGDVTGKFTLFSFSVPSLLADDANFYLQGGGGAALAFCKFGEKAPLDITGGHALLAGFGVNAKIQQNVLLDIAYNRIISLNKMQHANLIKISIGGRII